ncbi:hypothetical protein HDU81_005195 [Chytriomyces hyalinus]|nr:hypothetical protein HDU81_005195 [Chytriomyces hyalinus]
MTSALPSPSPSDTETGKESPNKPQTLGDVFIKTPLQLISHFNDSYSPLPPSSSSCPPSLTLCPSQSGDDEISLFDFSVTEHRESSSREDVVGLLNVEGGVCGWENPKQSGAAPGDSISDLFDSLLRPSQSCESLSQLDMLNSSMDFAYSEELDTLSGLLFPDCYMASDFMLTDTDLSNFTVGLFSPKVGSNVSLPSAAAATQPGDVIDQLLVRSACGAADSNAKPSVEADGSFGFIGDDFASLLDPNDTLASLLAQHSSLAGPMVSGSSHVPPHSNYHDRKEDPLAFLDAFFPPEPQQANIGVNFNDIFAHVPIPDGGQPSFHNFSAASSPFSATSTATASTTSAIRTPRNWHHKLTRARLPVLTDVPAKAVKSKLTIPATEPHEPTAPHEPSEPADIESCETAESQSIPKESTKSETASTQRARKSLAKSEKPVLRRSRRAHVEGPVQQSAAILPRPDVMPRVQPRTRKRGKRTPKPELTEPPVILPPSAFNTLEPCPIRNEFVCPWPQCGHGAARRYNIKMHYLTHVPLGFEDAEKYLKEAGVPVEACKYCDKVFRRRFDLQRHMKGMHGVSVMSDGALRLENGTGTGRGRKRKISEESDLFTERDMASARGDAVADGVVGGDDLFADLG